MMNSNTIDLTIPEHHRKVCKEWTHCEIYFNVSSDSPRKKSAAIITMCSAIRTNTSVSASAMSPDMAWKAAS